MPTPAARAAPSDSPFIPVSPQTPTTSLMQRWPARRLRWKCPYLSASSSSSASRGRACGSMTGSAPALRARTLSPFRSITPKGTVETLCRWATGARKSTRPWWRQLWTFAHWSSLSQLQGSNLETAPWKTAKDTHHWVLSDWLSWKQDKWHTSFPALPCLLSSFALNVDTCFYLFRAFIVLPDKDSWVQIFRGVRVIQTSFNSWLQKYSKVTTFCLGLSNF